MDRKEFAETVKELRRRMSLRQEKFVAEARATASTVARWENERGAIPRVGSTRSPASDQTSLPPPPPCPAQ
jgi:transcriptional regulator with XRE-family HTH domain